MDLGASSDRVLIWARSLAVLFGARIEVLHADWSESPRYFTEGQVASLAPQEATRHQDLHRVPLEELEKRQGEIPRDREVVLYCTCPNEASSAITAVKLRQVGISPVRPLRGGFHSWRQLGFPVESAFDPVVRQIAAPKFEPAEVNPNTDGRTGLVVQRHSADVVGNAGV